MSEQTHTSALRRKPKVISPRPPSRFLDPDFADLVDEVAKGGEHDWKKNIACYFARRHRSCSSVLKSLVFWLTPNKAGRSKTRGRQVGLAKSCEELADDAKISRASVERSLRKLRKEGLVRWTYCVWRKKGEHHKGRSVIREFHLNFIGVANLIAEGREMRLAWKNEQRSLAKQIAGEILYPRTEASDNPSTPEVTIPETQSDNPSTPEVTIPHHNRHVLQPGMTEVSRSEPNNNRSALRARGAGSSASLREDHTKLTRIIQQAEKIGDQLDEKPAEDFREFKRRLPSEMQTDFAISATAKKLKCDFHNLQYCARHDQNNLTDKEYETLREFGAISLRKELKYRPVNFIEGKEWEKPSRMSEEEMQASSLLACWAGAWQVRKNRICRMRLIDARAALTLIELANADQRLTSDEKADIAVAKLLFREGEMDFYPEGEFDHIFHLRKTETLPKLERNYEEIVSQAEQRLNARSWAAKAVL